MSWVVRRPMDKYLCAKFLYSFRGRAVDLHGVSHFLPARTKAYWLSVCVAGLVYFFLFYEAGKREQEAYS